MSEVTGIAVSVGAALHISPGKRPAPTPREHVVRSPCLRSHSGSAKDEVEQFER